MLNGVRFQMSKTIFALTYIDNIDGYSETVATSFDKLKLEQYCKENDIELDEDDSQYHTINDVSFLE